MKIYHAIIMLALLAFSSCAYYDGDFQTVASDVDGNVLFKPLIGENDVASIYGVANGNDNISVIASGCMFEVSGIPQDVFLAPFPGGSIETMENNIGLLRDVIPYIYDDYWTNNGISHFGSILRFPEHSMTYSVRQGEDTHTVCVTFGATKGQIHFRQVGPTNYWVYEFTMTILKMTVDGEIRPVPERGSIEYKLYYNRFKDSIG